MRTTTITQAKNGLSALIDRVKGGESVVILDRGRPVARLEPVAGREDPSGRLARLERSGTIRIGTTAPPVDELLLPGPALAGGASAVSTLLDERREGP